ncbi:MAG: serine/threonine protein kinase [Chloroflexi bacterium]|nr:serine/threonine protein kinase [Chloroflexota bacterium]
MEDLTGRQIGPYQVVAPLGEGGMAAVYKAYQPAMDRYVALKVLPRHYANDPQFINRFRQEAKVLARLQHPHILPVFDFGDVDGYTFIVMPYVEGGTLVGIMKGEPLPLAQIRRVISQVGDALDYAHVRGLIHRDVKPSNILIDERGNCLLMDFGLAKIVEDSIHITTSGVVMGTPAYMSPEQGLGEKLDARTDIYSLGVILYEMSVGRVPYKAETPMAVIIKHIHDPLPMPHNLNQHIPEVVERVILKSMAKNPDDRFATAGDFVKSLQAAIPEGAASASLAANVIGAGEPPVTLLPSSAVSFSLRKPAFQIGMGIVIATILGGILGATLHPFPGLILGGALGGLSIGWAWHQIDPFISRKQIATLVGIWSFSCALAWVLQGFFFAAVGLAGWLTALILKKKAPALTRRQIAGIAFGWMFSLIFGLGLAAFITSVIKELPAAILASLAIFAGGSMGGWIMFAQYRRAL